MKTKNTSSFIKIRPTISLFTISVISLILIIILTLQYIFSKDLAINASKNIFYEISSKIADKINMLDKKNNDILTTIEVFKNIDKLPDLNINNHLLPVFTKILSNNKNIYALYIGKENGNFYEVINLDVDESLRKRYLVNNHSKWLIVKINEKSGKRIKTEYFLNEKLEIQKTNSYETDYNPIKRPWYIKAISENSLIKTNPYLYSNIDQKGITYAKQINNTNSVIGIDITLNSLNQYLKEASKSNQNQLFLYKKDKTVFASANYKHKENELFTLPYNLTFNNLEKTFVKSINDEDYLVYKSKVNSIYKNSDYISILTPISVILNPYTQKIYYAIIITIIAIFAILPIIYHFTKLLVRPVHDLALENEKISKRKYDKVKATNTFIKEYHELSTSLVNMSKSIQDYEQNQKELIDSFIKTIAQAIDAKSKFTSAHCNRVPVLTNLIALEASKSNDSIFKDFELKNQDEIRELNIASWLHDCGKVTTPEYIIDKATKLETIHNRIHEIRTRFEVILRDKKIQMYENILNGKDKQKEEEIFQNNFIILQKEFELIANANIGSEYMTDEQIDKIKEISEKTWTKYFDDTLGLSQEEKDRLQSDIFESKEETLLSDKTEHIIKRTESSINDFKKFGFKMDILENLYNHGEIYNLITKKGTLTPEERFKINEHIIVTIKILEELPFPENLSKIPEYAGAHHETLIGTGYPRKLTKKDMSIPARIIALSDVFEALTASDRPYKKVKTLSESIKILSTMVEDKHIDEDIFKLFLKSGIYKIYSQKYLNKEQIDEVNINDYL